MNKKDREEKLATYESFIEDKLKPDLDEVQCSLERKSKQHREWTKLRHLLKHLKALKEAEEDIATKFHFGLGLHMTAMLDSSDTILVNIGCECILEMNYEEANKYAQIRLKVLNREMEHWRKQAATIKAHIKLVLLAIHEIQN